MDVSLSQIMSVLAVAMIVALVARRVNLPYTVGLVVVGVVLALSKVDFGLHLTRDFIFDLILPPLLFEAAITLSWPQLRRNIVPILVLSTFGTIMSAGVVAWGTAWLLGWPASSALVFGALIAATDPVAVIAMFKENKVKGRLRLLVESESLFNDAAAAVLFVIALAWSQSAENARTGIEMIGAMVLIIAGGIAIGALCGGAALIVAWRSSEHLILAVLTMVAAYGSFLIAEYFHASGVLATVTAGLMMANFHLLRGKSFLSPRGREFILGIWDFAAFLANSVVFFLIGVAVAAMPFRFYGTALLISVVVVLLGRALTVYPLSFLFLRSRWTISLREQHILWWGGLRGALALALALSMPPTLPLRDEIVVVTFGVVAFSIVVQGLTMPLLLRRLGFLPN
ncbi:cation:proton antiporter [Rhodoblastus sp.]|uniref:cation:proton antiporter n=1 Tax=Rhodoblastus sp. TaxID=1962975 RepID=UPI003F9AFAF5